MHITMTTVLYFSAIGSASFSAFAYLRPSFQQNAFTWDARRCENVRLCPALVERGEWVNGRLKEFTLIFPHFICCKLVGMSIFCFFVNEHFIFWPLENFFISFRFRFWIKRKAKIRLLFINKKFVFISKRFIMFYSLKRTKYWLIC